MSRGVVLLCVVGVAGCGGVVAPFQVTVERAAGFSRFTIVAAPEARINARLKPALELEGGTVFRFDAPHLTADSAYFVDPPRVAVSLPAGVHRGVVRAGVCLAGENVCRTFAEPVRF